MYRVHATNSFTADIIPLALASDATVTATWTKAALSAQPAYLLDTALEYGDGDAVLGSKANISYTGLKLS